MWNIYAATCLFILLSGCGQKAQENAQAIIALPSDVKQIQQDMNQLRQDVLQIKSQLSMLESEAATTKKQIEQLGSERDKVVDTVSSILKFVGMVSLILMLYGPVRNLIIRSLFRVFPYKPRRFDKDDK